VTEKKQHPTIEKLHERRKVHQSRHKVIRAGVVVLGVLITLAGIVMTGPVPGPGLLVIPLGLALLALEFTWAERLLERVVVWADSARTQAANRSRGEKITSGIAVAIGIAALVIAAILWDIPVLPV
jgi:uncharacterized protein (TIGR02611 family)